MAEQLTFHYPHLPSLAGEDFFVSASNRDAVTWIQNWPDWPAQALVLYGPDGCGKTHLASLWQEKAKALSLPSSLPLLDHHYVLEKADQLCEGAEFQNHLFHVLNEIQQQKTFLLITSSQPPAAWQVTLPDLASRLKALPAVAVSLPDDELLEALIKKLFRDRQIQIQPDVVNYLVRRIERSFSAAHQIVDQLDTLSLQHKRRITIDLARQLI